MEDRFQVGIITSPHGVKGEVKVYPTTSDNNRFKKLKDCYIELKGQLVPAKATGCKFFKNMVILKFEGFDNMNDVEKLRQCKIFVDRENAVKLEKDEYFVADLLDMTVVDEDGNNIGKITDVMETGANDVYVIGMNDGQEKLIPAIKDCILDVNMETGIMKVHLLKEMDD
ncbi:MAG: ribosome maturation factor RimM [Lachnospiraceae bacterium]|nr:ribosome maturation factor RimM [Lachnospiraceae bacterium]